MKDLALAALDTVARRGITYADVRVIDTWEREIATKNGKVGHAGSSESIGVGIRVLASGCWGFAATDDLSRGGIEAAASLALEIAHAGTPAANDPIPFPPETNLKATGTPPTRIDPCPSSTPQH